MKRDTRCREKGKLTERKTNVRRENAAGTAGKESERGQERSSRRKSQLYTCR